MCAIGKNTTNLKPSNLKFQTSNLKPQTAMWFLLMAKSGNSPYEVHLYERILSF
jgi:hypothetical protein